MKFDYLKLSELQDSYENGKLSSPDLISKRHRYSSYSIYDFETTLEEVRSNILRIKHEILNQYPDAQNIRFCVKPKPYDDGFELVVFYDIAETQEEQRYRLAVMKAYHEHSVELERENYMKLKAKFES